VDWCQFHFVEYRMVPRTLDAVVYSALLEPGDHVVHELMPGRIAWVHIVADEQPAAFTAEESTELLLVDLDEQSPPTRRSSTLPGSRRAS